MSSEVHVHHGGCTCSLSRPDETDAGDTAPVVVSWACPEGCDLSGALVSIRDAAGREVASAPLAAAADGEGPAASAELLVPLPAAAGDHSYTAVLTFDPATDHGLHSAAPEPFVLTAVPHALRLNVWGVPSAVGAGDGFEFKVGVKCSSACDLAGRKVRLLDTHGRKLAEAGLGAEHWPGTAALHYATLSATAPAEPGQHVLKLRVARSAAVPPHAAGSIDVPVNVVAASDCEVVVEAIDAAQHAPVANARVVLHPYRATTGPDGLARLRVARGDYRLQVSGARYVAVNRPLSVAGPVSARAELEREPPPRSPDEDYY